MRIPHSRADESIRQVLRLRTSTYTVTRRDYSNDGKSAMGESVPDETTLQVDAYLFMPSEQNTQIEFGERLACDLNGLALPSADVQVNDIYTHGGVDYQVETVDNRPSDDNDAYTKFALTRMENP